MTEPAQSRITRLISRLKRHPVVILLAAVAATATTAFSVFDGWHKFSEAQRPQETPPPSFRVRYFDISGHGISFLLIGKLDAHLQEVLGGRPVVWQNAVYAELRELHNEFAQSGMDPGYEFRSEALSQKQLAELPKNVALLPYAASEDIDLEPVPFIDEQKPWTSRDWVVSFREQATPNEIDSGLKSGEFPASSLLFSRDATCSEVADLVSHGAAEKDDFLKHVSAACGPFRIPLLAYFKDAGCGEGGWALTAILPRLSLRVAVIEPIGGKPIRISKIEQEQTFGPLSARAGQKETTLGRVGDGTLAPEERLVVPLNLTFEAGARAGTPEIAKTIPRQRLKHTEGYPDQEVSFVGDLVFVKPEATGPAAAASGGSEPGAQSDQPGADQKGSEIFRMKPATLFARYGVAPAIDTRVSPGITSSVKLTGMVVNNVKYPVEQVKAGATYITAEFEGGSCPRVYMEGLNAPMVQVGKILTGRDSLAKAGSNRLHLAYWPSRLQIVESEPETTHLEDLKVVCEGQDGAREVIEAVRDDKPMTAWPVVLEKGQSAAFVFEPEPHDCTTIFVDARGYYIPYSISSIKPPWAFARPAGQR
ncbi:hypothetical protein JJB11_12160 [Ramlibacter ginsenosidimutans]|uniref:Uncharacterized protein n=1 Tax=Ramlibacter ginsenosidimutans TaxID=502333 RepID=A0A934WMP8_9BURK|nr:hypothetical protein [Ramlibacter ginsenosidimutans]MBK6006845.1 hypothetical protein [Ramlibacter ginsenosidimutans]